MLFDITVKELLHAVHAGVCPAAARNLKFRTQEFREGILHYRLHTNGVCLVLPTCVTVAVVSYFKKEPHAPRLVYGNGICPRYRTVHNNWSTGWRAAKGTRGRGTEGEGCLKISLLCRQFKATRQCGKEFKPYFWRWLA
jgi:hypothetical protein